MQNFKEMLHSLGINFHKFYFCISMQDAEIDHAFMSHACALHIDPVANFPPAWHFFARTVA